MSTWAIIFCVGIIVIILLALAVCIYAAIYLSGTIAQAEEEQHNLWPLDNNRTGGEGDERR